MPWDEADRAKYEVIRDRYSTDMSDAEFELISPLLPAPKKLGRKPTDFRVVLNAVFYMIRVGCPWRLLPHSKLATPGPAIRDFRADGRISPRIGAVQAVFVQSGREARIGNLRRQGRALEGLGQDAGRRARITVLAFIADIVLGVISATDDAQLLHIEAGLRQCLDRHLGLSVIGEASDRYVSALHGRVLLTRGMNLCARAL